MKNLIDNQIKSRLSILNMIEDKKNIDDVVYTISYYDQNPRVNIYLTPYINLSKATEKVKMRDVVLKSLINKTFFEQIGIDISNVQQILFFSFDIVGNVDYCFFIDYINLIQNTIVYDLNGNKLITKEFEIEEIAFQSSISDLERSTKKFERPYYLFFDTETTGLPINWQAPVSDLNNWPRLVQLAYIFYDKNENEICKGCFIIKPEGFTIPFNSSKVHGISTERANEEGEELLVILKEFHSLVNTSDYLVAHNISFDEKIIGAEFLRNGLINNLDSIKKICTMESTTNFCAINGPRGYKWPKLSELYFKLFKFQFEENHNAGVDVAATSKCFWELKKIGKI